MTGGGAGTRCWDPRWWVPGKDGGAALALRDLPLLVPHPDTARVREAHQFLPHRLMDRIAAGLRS